MSDYMFMLDNHLSSEQSRMVEEIQAVTQNANVNLYLTGGALRDMLGGFPLHEIDFTVEAQPAKLARTLEAKAGCKILASDDHRKIIWIEFPGGVRTSLAMARTEKYTKPGAKPQVQAATIHEDLRGRDFTVNAIALSLSRASRGLLIDPTNGAGDLERKELRAVSNYTLYDDPSRILRMFRLQVRLGFAIEERTRMQYQNVREAQLETRIPPALLRDELQRIAQEPDPGQVLQVLQQENLLGLFSPALAGGNVNLSSFEKLHRVRQLIVFGVPFSFEPTPLFFNLLTEKFSPKERTALVKDLEIPKAVVTGWQALETRAKALEKELKSAKLNKPSRVWAVASKSPGDQLLFLLLKSSERLVQDRIKHYLQKYLPTAHEITERDVLAAGAEPGTAKGERVREHLILTHLDARPKKAEPAPPVETAAPPLPSPAAPARR